MITILADHDIEGQIVPLWRLLEKEGWADLIPLQLATFAEVELPYNSNDRVVWRFAQARGMILLTNNRNMKGRNSLEQTLREENELTSFPVITIGDVNRLTDRDYRRLCAAQLLDLILDLENQMGRGRIFIPS